MKNTDPEEVREAFYDMLWQKFPWLGGSDPRYERLIDFVFAYAHEIGSREANEANEMAKAYEDPNF